MRTTFLIVFVGVLALATVPASAQAADGPGVLGQMHGFSYSNDVYDVSYFYRPLAPYGDWVNVAPYGWVWIPYNVSPDWRPYSEGRWIYTEYGWTWMSYEPWGWATYHYGRWYYDPWYGWVWVPGTQWAPAWVAWRWGGGWVGWAPLPPQYAVRPGVSFSNPTALGPQVFRRFAWCFVEARQFYNPNLRPYIARSVRNVNLVNLTQDVTRYNYQSNNYINIGIDLRNIERATGRSIEKYRIVDSRTPPAGNSSEISGREVRLFRPRISDGPAKTDPTKILGRPQNPMRPSNPSQGYMQRQNNERQALEDRLKREREALIDRQKRESVRLSKQLTPEQLKQWQQRELGAFEDLVDRERKLVHRQQDREKTGTTGVGQTDKNRFRWDGSSNR